MAHRWVLKTTSTDEDDSSDDDVTVARRAFNDLLGVDIQGQIIGEPVVFRAQGP